MNSKKHGFTLIEILVTMGIIGIVAAMTVPQLVNNYQRKMYVTSLKKVHSDIEQAFSKYLRDKNVNSLILTDFQQNPQAFFNDYIKMNKKQSTFANTFGASYKNINGNASTFSATTCGNNGYYYITKGGASICIPNPCSVGECQIYIDTNGSAGPNINGRDLFSGYIWEDGSIDVVSPTKRQNLSVSELQTFRTTAMTAPTNDDSSLTNIIEQINNQLNNIADNAGRYIENLYTPKFAYLGDKGNSMFHSYARYSQLERDPHRQNAFLKEQLEIFKKSGGKVLGDEAAILQETSGYFQQIKNALRDQQGLINEYNNLYNTAEQQQQQHQAEFAAQQQAYEAAKAKKYGTCKGEFDNSKSTLTCLGSILTDDWSMEY